MALEEITFWQVECDRCLAQAKREETADAAKKVAVRAGFTPQRGSDLWFCADCLNRLDPPDLKTLREQYGLSRWELDRFIGDASARVEMIDQRPYLSVLADDVEQMLEAQRP